VRFELRASCLLDKHSVYPHVFNSSGWDNDDNGVRGNGWMGLDENKIKVKYLICYVVSAVENCKAGKRNRGHQE
jgi:hypothetical protein